MRPPSADQVRALAERLIEVPSVSPDPAGEDRVADLLLAALPAPLERGVWPLPDGRRVVWARLRGRTRRTLLALGHLDTVGVEEYAELGADGARLAFRPRELRGRLLGAAARGRAPALASDLDEERRHPGSWLLGRGSLDMKSGLAAAIATLGTLAASGKPPAGDVLLVITPDEEHESAGMLEAVVQLARFKESGAAEWIGALNLDYSNDPAAYAGVLGKALVGMWVRGVPTHAGDPFAGLDAIQLAAAIARRLSASPALRDVWEGRPGPPPVALKLRDLKPGYNVQTAGEAVIEWNVLTSARPLEATLALVERETRAALEQLATEMRGLSGGSAAWHAEPAVRSFAALAGGDAAAPRAGEDSRAFSLRAVRESVAAAGIEGPVVVPYLLPPFYPAALPRASAWTSAARAALEKEGVPVCPLYPFISDACYLAWRGAPEGALAARMPAWNRPYRLPIAAIQSLDLDVLNLGPWGRDAHGMGERVNAAWAFGRLPSLLASVIEAGLGTA